MKNFVLVLSLLSFNALAETAKVPAKAELKKEVSAAKDYNIETSKISWLGKKVGGEHSGLVSLKNGSLKFDNKNWVGGQFVIDMTSITVEDIPKNDENNGKLVGHLKNDDFFAVDKNPTATLTILSAKKVKGNTYDVEGDLLIKGVSNKVNFKADLVDSAKEVKAKAKIVFDRTKWGLNYKSKILDQAMDKFIYDDVEMNVDLVAKK